MKKVKIPKTQKCNWCYKRKLTDNGYQVCKYEKYTQNWFICVTCNIKYDIV